MITLRILLAPGRRGRVVDASGRSLPQPAPAPVIGSAEPLRIILLDPATLDPADPYGFDTGAPLRLTISGDWDPATIPVYATNALVRTAAGTYDLADPSGTRTAEALALLGVLAERLCAWELTAYGGDPESEADWAHPLSVVQFDAPLRQRADSLGGNPAEAPAVDLRGPAGPAATVTVGETDTLPPGSPATVENVGTSSAVILKFGIPGGSSGGSLPKREITVTTESVSPEYGSFTTIFADRSFYLVTFSGDPPPTDRMVLTYVGIVNTSGSSITVAFGAFILEVAVPRGGVMTAVLFSPGDDLIQPFSYSVIQS